MKNEEGFDNEQDLYGFNKVIFHPLFNKTISELNELNIKLPTYPVSSEMDFNLYNYPSSGKLVSSIEEFKSYKLYPERGEELLSKTGILGYDESINKFIGLEGTAILTSHSLVLHDEDDYLSSNFLTFYFYTRSKVYANRTNIRYSQDPETDSKKDYIKDRTKFIVNNTPKNSIIFIDGPLIGGQISNYTVKLNNELLKKNVIPVFFVKNSRSNLITEHIKDLKGKYNSDMHWSYKFLKKGERTSFFKYEDQYNPCNAKLFCYLKTFDISPQRIEFHIDVFKKYGNIMLEIMNLIYYLMLVQGNLKNPQIRPIAIAEMYARETLKLINLNKLMNELGIMSTLNQERFGWG